MDMELVIKNRRSIRKYLDKDVPNEIIDKLIESARLCQSANNRQQWKFMILKGDDKNKIAEIMLNFIKKNNIDLPGYINSSKYTAEIILNAPVLILAFKEHDEGWAIGDLVSIGAAIEHICLEAVNLGLGSLWIRDTAYTEKEICNFVGYNDLDLVSAIAVGYKDESPEPRPRKSREEIIINIK